MLITQPSSTPWTPHHPPTPTTLRYVCWSGEIPADEETYAQSTHVSYLQCAEQCEKDASCLAFDLLAVKDKADSCRLSKSSAGLRSLVEGNTVFHPNDADKTKRAVCAKIWMPFVANKGYQLNQQTKDYPGSWYHAPVDANLTGTVAYEFFKGTRGKQPG